MSRLTSYTITARHCAVSTDGGLFELSWHVNDSEAEMVLDIARALNEHPSFTDVSIHKSATARVDF